MASAIRHPSILWAQRSECVLLTSEVEDMNVTLLKVEGNKFHIQGSNIQGVKYEAELELYADLKGDTHRIPRTRHVELTLPKETGDWWPRLLETTAKVQWIKVDFNKWVDEDEAPATPATHPTITWDQDMKNILLTVEVQNMNVTLLKVEGNKFHIQGSNKEGVKYEAELELYAAIKGVTRYNPTARHVELIIAKEKVGMWFRLLETIAKVQWLKTCLNKMIPIFAKAAAAEISASRTDQNQMEVNLKNPPVGTSGGREFVHRGGRGGGKREKKPIPEEGPYRSIVENLPLDMTEFEFNQLFQGLSISSVDMKRDKVTGHCEGFAYVEFDNREDLEKALDLDGGEFDKKIVRIDVAKDRFDNRRRRDIPHNSRGNGHRRGGHEAAAPSVRISAEPDPERPKLILKPRTTDPEEPERRRIQEEEERKKRQEKICTAKRDEE